MSTAVTVEFPFGRYHATPWDQGPNSGAVEWPPSPWRLLRAFVAVGHTRCPDVSAHDVDTLLSELGNPDAYRTSEITVGSTRHYLPDVKKRSGDHGDTDQVLDAFARTSRGTDVPQVVIYWNHDLTEQSTRKLTTIVDRMPYLGRSESVCVAKLDEFGLEPDSTWWRLGAAGESVETTVLLGADGTPTRKNLEATTTEVRKHGNMYPPGTALLSYGRVRSDAAPARPSHTSPEPLGAIQFQLVSSVPARMRSMVLLADAFHGALRRRLDGLPTEDIEPLVGRNGPQPRTNQHDHAHILVCPDTVSSIPIGESKIATTLTLWAPMGIDPQLVHEITSKIRTIGTRRDHLAGQFPDQRLLVLGAGKLRNMLPEHLFQPSSRWLSLTPYLPVRHRHRKQSLEDYLREDLTKECGYRGLPDVQSVRPLTDRSAAHNLAQYRRRRMTEHMPKNRPGHFCEIEFAEEVTVDTFTTGPGAMLLGQLSHFGFGWFTPIT